MNISMKVKLHHNSLKLALKFYILETLTPYNSEYEIDVGICNTIKEVSTILRERDGCQFSI
jgi:hypothetical protein